MPQHQYHHPFRVDQQIECNNPSLSGEPPQDLETHSCTYSDFFNKYNKQMDYLGLTKFKCIRKKNYIIQGIFSDQIFSYFEVSLLSKNKSAELINEIERFLFENDCKLNIAFIDIIIDLDNYENPMTRFLNDEIFIQLDPVYYTKMNVYFMHQEFAEFSRRRICSMERI